MDLTRATDTDDAETTALMDPTTDIPFRCPRRSSTILIIISMEVPCSEHFPPPFHSSPGRGPMDGESRMWQERSPAREGNVSHHDGPLESTRNPGDNSPEKPVQTYNVIQVADLEKTLPSLVNELDAAKEMNRTLSEKLLEAEREIESLKLAKSLAEVSTEAEIAAKGAALIEEIYRAQKERDAAVMAKLRIANEERDEAILRLKKLEMSKDLQDESTDIHFSDDEISPTDSSMGELLTRLTRADGGEEISKYGHVIMGKIGLTRDRKKRITSEEMRAILDERDMALAKCKKLEQEIAYLRKCNDGASSKNNQELAMRAQLQATQQERNVALAKVRKLEDELQTLSVYYSLHKSLSQEQNLRDQFNNTLGSFEDQIKVRDEYLMKTQKDRNDLVGQLQQAVAEKNTMAAQYQQALHLQAEANEKSAKLERLVNVLRKKLAEGTPKIVS
ncbi:mirror-image polydactyly gene 1 protein-like [Ptychodera flava]|uniref:mirror-image polydactyly gene 1 protein-like n=1 Tax=Ptychodera flava TaxID=63121 RepID=UPI00396A153D